MNFRDDTFFFHCKHVHIVSMQRCKLHVNVPVRCSAARTGTTFLYVNVHQDAWECVISVHKPFSLHATCYTDICFLVGDLPHLRWFSASVANWEVNPDLQLALCLMGVLVMVEFCGCLC